MKRARQLLRASRSLRTQYHRRESFQLNIINCSVLVWSILQCINSCKWESKDFEQAVAIQFYAIQCLCLIIPISMICGLYTGFLENRKRNNKSDLRQFAIQLPLVKEDFVKALFLDSIERFFIIAIGFSALIFINEVWHRTPIMYICTGVGVLIFMSIIIIEGIERGICIYIYINATLRGCLYFALLIIVISLGLMSKGQAMNFARNIHTRVDTLYILDGLQLLGGVSGFIGIICSFAISYLLMIKLSRAMYKLGRQGNVGVFK